MKNEIYNEILKNSVLFKGINDNGDINSLLSCLNAGFSEFKKGEYIMLAGDELKHIGIVVSGQLSIVKEDLDIFEEE